MKKILALIFSISFIFMSCKGDQGPPGRDGLDGLDGLDGGLIVGQMFERTVDFTSGNDFEVLIDIPGQIEVLDTDIIVVYTLVEINNGVDVWEPLPQTFFLNDGILLYGFNYTLFDVNIFLDGTVILDDLPADLTQAITFRMIVIPADDAENIDLNNIEHLMEVIQFKNVEELN